MKRLSSYGYCRQPEARLSSWAAGRSKPCGRGLSRVRDAENRPYADRKGDHMLKFLGSMVGVIFLIGLVVVVLLLMLIF
jgi:hypothetical protein